MMKNEHLSDGKCFVNITEETGEAGRKEGRVLRNMNFYSVFLPSNNFDCAVKREIENLYCSKLCF